MDVRTCPSCRNYRFITEDGVCRKCASESIPSEEFTKSLRGMCAMTSLGMTLKESMQMISAEEQKYGEISEHFRKVVQVTSNNKSIAEALEECARKVESDELGEFYMELSQASKRGHEHVHGYLINSVKKRI